MSHLLCSRRGLLSVMALGASAYWIDWQSIAGGEPDSVSLQALARKIIDKVSPEIIQACKLHVSAQLHDCETATVVALMAPLLHADDQAHARMINIEGVSFSQTQIGLLALLYQGGVS